MLHVGCMGGARHAGHHASKKQAQGFCIYNNVALAALVRGALAAALRHIDRPFEFTASCCSLPRSVVSYISFVQDATGMSVAVCCWCCK